MTTMVYALFISAVLCGSAMAKAQQLGNTDPHCCALVGEALADAGRLHTGMKRSEVERLFTRDGGVTFRGDTTYVYKKCPLIKLHVKFDLPTPASGGAENDDLISSISSLSIEGEIKD
jgi:hypothetical protein